MKKYIVSIPMHEIEVEALDEAEAIMNALHEIRAEDLKVVEIFSEA